MGPDMAVTLDRDMARHKLDRLQYFKSLLEARYRKVVLEEGPAGAEQPKKTSKK
jgi:hypothetical protein